MSDKPQKIIVAGGGTAGLITALILKRRLNVDVKVLAPKDIGIIGVGEGSTEHWADFLFFMQETASQSLIKTKGTIKTGIFFDGWTPGRGNYIHTISGDWSFKMGNSSALYFQEFADGVSNRDLAPPEQLVSKLGDFYNKDGQRHEAGGFNQFHFNTFELNNYLVELCNKFKVDVIDDKITNLHVEDGEIEWIETEKGGRETADWYIDSTGFKRLLISAVGGYWQSYRDYLPLKEAIAFPTEDQEPNYNLWTRAKAMKNGWMWTIPTYGRTGNGYIFDTDFINKDQAHEEVNKVFGREIEIAKHIKFNPGKVNKSWIKNVIAVGLSANFLEPLEATSIGTSIQSAFALMHRLHRNTSQHDIDQYNRQIDSIFYNTRDFVALHYINDNRQSDFWQRCSELKIPSSLERYLEVWKTRPLDQGDTDEEINGYNLFAEDNFNMIAYCHGILKSETVKNYINSFNPHFTKLFREHHYKLNLKMRRDPDNYQGPTMSRPGIGFIKHKDYIKELHRQDGKYWRIVYEDMRGKPVQTFNGPTLANPFEI